MIKTVQKSAKSEDEAIRLALEELSLTRDDVSVVIIERAKSGFLGIGASPAVVEVSCEIPDVKSDRVREFIDGLLIRFGVSAEIEVSEEVEGTVSVVLTADEPGALIGRRGETLDAIQHLANYAVNRGGGSRMRVNVDTENYRQRRGNTLEALAEKTAAKVLKYRRNITLDPMNAYERHMVHTALQENEFVSTHSVGSEPNRRVVVVYGKSSAGEAARRPSSRQSSSTRPPRDRRRTSAPAMEDTAVETAPSATQEAPKPFVEPSASSTVREWK